jgi:Xaa-Pro aminopeptidase
MPLLQQKHQRISSRKNLVIVAASRLLMGLASTYLENFSTATNRWVGLPLSLLKGPTISIPHTAREQVMGMVFCVEPGIYI